MHLPRKISTGVLKCGLLTAILLAILVAAGSSVFARDKYETIDAQAFGTGTQLGQNIGVTLNIYEFSTPADRTTLVQAFQKGQNLGLVTALQKMKAIGGHSRSPGSS